MVLLAKPNSLPMHIHEGLAEVSSFTRGYHTGEAYTRQITDYYSGAIDRIDNGETIDEALDRFEDALEEIANRHRPDKNIGIVTHGYILSFLTGKYSDLLPRNLHNGIKKPDVAVIDWGHKSFVQLWG